MNIVLDTNVLIMSISSGSRYHTVWSDFLYGKYTLCITNEILLEYEEVFSRKMGTNMAAKLVNTILQLDNVMLVEDYFKMQLITADPDDNKFVDCAFAANARYIVSEDHHYNVLREIDYPRIEVTDIESFVAML
jgi:putative PIN family toxin of toxin-antitoxin system